MGWPGTSTKKSRDFHPDTDREPLEAINENRPHNPLFLGIGWEFD